MNGVNLYKNKDGRLRGYIIETGETRSYPKLLMEEYLERKLNDDEIVHHIDENPLNNDIDNLKVMTLSEHARYHRQKYFDKYMICPECGKEFLWTAKQQLNHYGNYNRSDRRDRRNMLDKPFCSRHCSGIYGQRVQTNRRSK